jgi:cellulose synthase/poly-beta-1,6-N-acetylglucosamine synthase-like glycosyltransferase
VLSAILLGAIVAALLATLALFGTGRWAIRRSNAFWLPRAVVATAVLAAVTWGVMALIGATRHNLIASCIALVGASVLWMPVTRRWNARAHLCWAATWLLFVSYLAFMIQWTFASHLGLGGTVGSLLLWFLEVVGALMGCAYLWELCDALGRVEWRRRVTERALSEAGGAAPFVSLHVPAYNEPPEMVIETLQSLKALDYPNYEIIAIDDNSDDEALWRPLERWCRENSVKFAHLEDWPGYKSGALNYALRNLTDPRAELIGVIDADYQIDSEFLVRCAPLFEDPHVGFIQAPQDYRGWEGDPFYRRLYYSYRYFFSVSQPSRNETDGAIFAGTMGLIRRRALEEVGGWDEWCITEDAELSLRLLRRGYSGLHVDRSFGKGVMPLTFEALKGQRFRWCFGGVQIVRRNWRVMLPGRKTEDNQLDLGQRWAYLSGAVQWYGDLLALIFFVFLLVGAANVAWGGGLLFRKLTAFLVAVIPVMVILGLVRAVALLRRGTGASWREAVGAFMIWQSTVLVVARACVQGLFASEAEFLRTPKTSEAPSLFDAVRGNRSETLLALIGLAGIVAALTRPTTLAGGLTAVLLIWPTLAFAAAPYNSLAARRAVLPDELRARRASEFMRTPAGKGVIAVGGLAATGAAAVVVAALLAPGVPVVGPKLVSPTQGHHVQYGPAAPNGPTTTTTVPPRSPTSTTVTTTTVTTTTTPASSSTSASTGSTSTSTVSPQTTNPTTTTPSTKTPTKP